jgi:hypothetical protein
MPLGALHDSSINLSNESPIETAPPTLVIANLDPRTDATPVSPRSVLAILEANPNLDSIILRGLIEGLTLTIRDRERWAAEQRRRLEVNIRELHGKVLRYEEVFEQTPDGFQLNDGRLPNFHIPVGNGQYRPAKWIKCLEGGRVAGFTEEDGPHSTPHIINAFAPPAYSDNDDPIEPMPAWFRRTLTGPEPGFQTMRQHIATLDNWGLLAEVTRYREIQSDLSSRLHRSEELQAEIDSLRHARDQSEGRLTAAEAHKHATQFEFVSGPHACNQPRWKKKDDGRGHPF